jgi:hypothetical protein
LHAAKVVSRNAMAEKKKTKKTIVIVVILILLLESMMETLKKITIGVTALAATAGVAYYVYTETMSSLQRNKKITIEAGRMGDFFKNQQQIADMALQSFLPGLKEKLFELTSTSDLQTALKGTLTKEEKKAAWQKLLVLTIARVISGVYVVSLLVLISRIQFNIISRAVYSDKMVMNDNGIEQETISLAQQKKILDTTKFLASTGVGRVTAAVVDAVNKEVLVI